MELGELWERCNGDVPYFCRKSYMLGAGVDSIRGFLGGKGIDLEDRWFWYYIDPLEPIPIEEG